MHYKRFLRNGSTGTAEVWFKSDAGAVQSFMNAHLSIVLEDFPDTCVDWVFGKSSTGYGSLTWPGHSTPHRLVCESFHGAAPPGEHHAAHSCGRRICINPRHLRWATPPENQADRYTHGTDQLGEKNPNVVLTAAQVRGIRADTGTHDEIAQQYGVSRATVSLIRSGKRWAHLA